MFSRLLKYDIKAVLKIAIIISLSAIGASLLGGAALRTYFTLSGEEDTRLLRSLLIVVFVLSIFAVLATSVVISVLVFVRFYKNLYTDEGYLTFTLPTSRKTIHLAKTANAVIFTLYESVLIFVCFVIYAAFIPDKPTPPLPPGSIWPFSPIFTAGVIILLLLIFFVSIVFSVCTVQLCITIGAVLARRAKLIVGIVSYYAISSILQFAVQMLAVILNLTLGDATTDFLDSLTTAGIEAFVLIALALIATVTAALATLMFCITQRIIDKRLNLA